MTFPWHISEISQQRDIQYTLKYISYFTLSFSVFYLQDLIFYHIFTQLHTFLYDGNVAVLFRHEYI